MFRTENSILPNRTQRAYHSNEEAENYLDRVQIQTYLTETSQFKYFVC